jgi:hypothetical protein
MGRFDWWCHVTSSTTVLRTTALATIFAAMLSTGCGMIFGFEDAPPASECAYSRDCPAGKECIEGACVSNCDGDACLDAVASSERDANPESQATDQTVTDAAPVIESGSDAEAGSPSFPPAEAGEDSSGDSNDSGCSTCTVSDLPRPCRGRPYSEPMIVSGGTPPYRWQASAPDGLILEMDSNVLDGSRARLSGTMVDSGMLTVTITDAAGLYVTRAYVLEPREKCWLAYLSADDPDPQVHLVDPLLTTFAPIEPHKSRVSDFRFSPDGRRLVYRFTDASAPDAGHLSMITLSTGEDTALDFSEDAVASYAWSDDSATLAVGFRRATTSYLGGIRLSPSGGNPEAGTTLLDSTDAGDGGGSALVMLQPTATPDSAGLLWFGAGYVAFHAPANVSSRRAYYAKLDADRFQAPKSIAWDYTPPVLLRAGDRGFFAISIAQPASLNFNSFENGEPPLLKVDDGNVISPSGAFTAPLPGDSLQLFRALDDPAFSDPWAEQGGCPRLIGWAKARERLACVADTSDPMHGESHGEVRIFDLDSAKKQLKMSPVGGYCVKGTGAAPCSASEYDYTQAKSNARRRAFSPSGRWFAFATTATQALPTDDYLYIADLDSDPMQLKRKDWSPFGGSSVGSQIELAFSSDETMVLQQRGATLVVHNLTVGNGPGEGIMLLTSDLKPVSPCSEDFGSAPDRWCGSIANAAPFTWSSQPALAAFKTTQGIIVVEIFRSSFTKHVFPMTDCDERCSAQFEFQP